MSYRLYRRIDLVDSDAGAELLGVYRTFDAALAARDRDTIRVFETTPHGAVMQVRHDIVGPGTNGPATSHPVTTSVERRTFGDPAEVDEVRRWLDRVHAATS